ncbi:uncharacterized protein LOC111125928 [Crassostrea virginica]
MIMWGLETPKISLFIFLFVFHLPYHSKCDCGDDVRKPTEGHGCCSNYHMVDGHCKACPSGFFGNACSVQCPYPSFGLICGDTCNCSQSECDPTFGCKKHESTTDLLPTISQMDKTTARSATAHIQPATAVMNTDKASHHETNTQGDHFVVALSVTVATSAIIVLAVVFTKLRNNTTANLVYYIQSPDGCTIMEPDNQVPCRNPDTDTYTDIKDLQDISMSRFGGILESDKIDAFKMNKLSKITKTV